MAKYFRLGLGSLVLGLGVEIVASVLPLLWDNPPKWLLLLLFALGGTMLVIGFVLILPIPNPIRFVRRRRQLLRVEPRTRDHPHLTKRRDVVLNIVNSTGEDRVERCAVRVRRLQWADELGDDRPRITESSDYFLGWNARGDGPRYQTFATNAILDVAFTTGGDADFQLNTTDGIPFNVSILSDWLLTLEFSADNVKPFEKRFFLRVHSSPESIAAPGLPSVIDFHEVGPEDRG